MREMNPLLENVAESKGFELIKSLEQLKKQGKRVYAFNIGEPCFMTPENIKQAAIDAIVDNQTKYAAVNGIEPLRTAIANKLKTDNNLDYSSDQIIVSTGAKQVLYNALRVLVKPGDEVLLFAPYWESYEQLVNLAGAKPVIVECALDNGFIPKIEDIEAAITDKTQLMMLNSPNNPTGAVYPKELLEEIAELIIKNDLYLLDDEMYEKLIYNGKKHYSIVALNSELYDRTVVINGFSKTYAMTGWRLGYGAGPKEIIKRMGLIQTHATSNASTPLQFAAIEAISGCQDEVEIMRQAYFARFELAYQKLCAIDHLKVGKVDGAFYLMVDAKHYLGLTYHGTKIDTIEQLCLHLLQDRQVAVSPGTGFHAPTSFRISYAGSLEDIEDGLNQLAAYLKEYK